MQLLKEVVPGLTRVACMPIALQSARKGAQMLHVSLAVYEVHDTTDVNKRSAGRFDREANQKD